MSTYETEIKQLRAELATAQQQFDAVTKTLAARTTDLALLRESIRTGELEAHRLAGAIKAVVEKVEEVEHMNRCPTCQTKADGWQEPWLKKLSDEQILAEAAALKVAQTIKDSRESEAMLLKTIQNEELRLATFRKTLNDLADQIEVKQLLNQKAAAAELEAQKQKTAAEAAKVEQARLAAERQAAETKAATERAEAESKAKAARAALEGQERALLDSLPAALSNEAMDALQAKVLTARGYLTQLETKQKNWLKVKAAEATVAAAQKERGKLEAKKLVLDLAVAAVQGHQERLVGVAVGELMEGANMFLRGILPGELEYRADLGDFGYWADGVQGFREGWVSHATFSGTRRALAYVGLSVALAAQSPIRLVLLDELGVMDPVTRATVVQRLCELVAAGKIDQAILCDSNKEMWLEPVKVQGLPPYVGLKVIEVAS